MRCCCEKFPLLLNQQGVQVYTDLGVHVSIGEVQVHYCPFCGSRVDFEWGEESPTVTSLPDYSGSRLRFTIPGM